MNSQRVLSCRAEEGVHCLPIDALTPAAALPKRGGGGLIRLSKHAGEG